MFSSSIYARMSSPALQRVATRVELLSIAQSMRARPPLVLSHLHQRPRPLGPLLARGHVKARLAPSVVQCSVPRREATSVTLCSVS